jgi:hypothetical protein
MSINPELRSRAQNSIRGDCPEDLRNLFLNAVNNGTGTLDLSDHELSNHTLFHLSEAEFRTHVIPFLKAVPEIHTVSLKDNNEIQYPLITTLINDTQIRALDISLAADLYRQPPSEHEKKRMIDALANNTNLKTLTHSFYPGHDIEKFMQQRNNPVQKTQPVAHPVQHTVPKDAHSNTFTKLFSKWKDKLEAPKAKKATAKPLHEDTDTKKRRGWKL